MRGEKIEGRLQAQGVDDDDHGEAALKQGARSSDPNSAERDPMDNNFQMMNARGETNISFYDFQRTWSIEDYEDNDDDEEDVEDDSSPGDLRRRRRLSLIPADNKNQQRYHHHQQYQRRIVRPPSPKTKQVIRVKVVRVANS